MTRATRPEGQSTGETVKAYIDEKERIGRLDYKARRKLVRALDLFSGWIGAHTPIELVTKRQVGDFRSALTRCPLNHAERFPGLALKEILEKTEHDDLPRLKTATINSYLAAVSGFFDWCDRGEGSVRTRRQTFGYANCLEGAAIRDSTIQVNLNTVRFEIVRS